MFRRLVAAELIVRDLAGCTAFYRDTIGLEAQESGPDSAAFRIGDAWFFLFGVPAAARLTGAAASDLARAGGPRGLLAAEVADVDAAHAALTAKGVAFLRPPTDQPWGLRTAHFADPEGNLWEIHQPVGTTPAR